ncbi:MAG: LysE family transporter, partial [Nocardioides sp.]
MDLASALAGLVAGLSLIVAIGAQNAYVLRQGLRREHVGAVVSVCALSDLVLILAGVAGIGALVERAPTAIEVVRWLGVAFLTAYALMSLWRARRAEALHAEAGRTTSRRSAVARATALTWLNPHV